MKTIFKKIAAVCLSMAVMVGVMGATNWGNSAVAASPNLLETSSFEAEGTLPSYLLSDAKAAFLAGNLNGWFAGGNAKYGKDGAIVAEDGNYALSMTGRASQQIKGLAAGSTYVVSFKAKRAAAYSSATVNLRCRVVKTKLDAENSVYPTADKVGGSIYALYQTAKGSAYVGLGNTYTEYSFTFTAGSDIAADECVLLQFADQAGNGAKRVMLDDIVVVKQQDSLLYDGGFDATTAVASAPSAADYAANHIWYRVNGDGKILTESDLNRCYPLKGYLHQSVLFNKGTVYTLAFKAKSATGSAGAATLTYAVCKTANRGTYVATKDITLQLTSTWQSYFVTLRDLSVEDGTVYSLRLFDKNNQSTASILLDDLALYEEQLKDNGEVTDLFEFMGNSIRSVGNQALRFKYGVEKLKLQRAAFHGFTISEYGFVAQQTQSLNGQALVKENARAVQAAYKADGSLDTIVSETDLEKTVRAALYNIGYNKQQQTTDYSVYGESFTCRPYIVLVNDSGYSITVYAEQQTADVFSVMQAILEATGDDAQTKADQASVAAVLENKDILNAYNSWYSAKTE